MFKPCEITEGSRVHVMCRYGLDGSLAALLVHEFYPTCRIKQITNNGRELDDPTILDCDFLFLLDYSFADLSAMRGIMNNPRYKLIWIDHGAATSMPSLAKREAFGNRDETKSTTLLTWEYLYPDHEPPEFVTYVNEYITRITTTTDRWKKSLYFAYGLDAQPTNPLFDKSWTLPKRLMTEPEFIDKLIADGEIVDAYYRRKSLQLARFQMFPTRYAGYDVMAINAPLRDCRLFQVALSESERQRYSFWIAWRWMQGLNGWRATIYSSDPKHFPVPPVLQSAWNDRFDRGCMQTGAIFWKNGEQPPFDLVERHGDPNPNQSYCLEFYTSYNNTLAYYKTDKEKQLYIEEHTPGMSRAERMKAQPQLLAEVEWRNRRYEELSNNIRWTDSRFLSGLVRPMQMDGLKIAFVNDLCPNDKNFQKWNERNPPAYDIVCNYGWSNRGSFIYRWRPFGDNAEEICQMLIEKLPNAYIPKENVKPYGSAREVGSVSFDGPDKFAIPIPGTEQPKETPQP